MAFHNDEDEDFMFPCLCLAKPKFVSNLPKLKDIPNLSELLDLTGLSENTFGKLYNFPHTREFLETLLNKENQIVWKIYPKLIQDKIKELIVL
jgi:hypothetical protein